MKAAQIAQLAFVVLAALAVYSFVATARDAEARRLCTPLCVMKPNYAARNRLAPDFELPKTSGGTGKLSDYRGKVVILNFWTKTCQPCLEEMPSLAKLALALREHPEIELVTVSTDESVEDVRNTLASVLGDQPPFPVFVDAEADVVGGLYGTRLYPETWYIDPSGVIRARFDGARNWGEALPIDLAETYQRGPSCQIEFDRAVASGRMAGLCGELGG